MGSNTMLLFLFLCFLQLLNNGLGSSWTLSNEENSELERKLALLNKPSIKTIVNDFGNIYDCVEFNKQPAFDPILLKNFASKFQNKSTTLKHKKSGADSSNIQRSLSIKSNGEECPRGTVPIRRTTKLDLIRERLALKARSSEIKNDPGILGAGARTKSGSQNFSGATASLSLHNPKVSGKQYSAARIKIQLYGDESMEAGWRVDPTLYGDTKTRFYIKTKTSESECFNHLCHGFVMVAFGFPLDYVFNKLSQPGQSPWEIQIYITSDKYGNWRLMVGAGLYYVGYWQSHIFKNQSGFANYVEWGGEVYSPPGVVEPGMGAGTFQEKDPKYVASFSSILSETNHTTYNDHDDLEKYTDNSTLYSIVDQGWTGGDHYGHLVLYGGPVNKKKSAQKIIG